MHKSHMNYLGKMQSISRLFATSKISNKKKTQNIERNCLNVQLDYGLWMCIPDFICKIQNCTENQSI